MAQDNDQIKEWVGQLVGAVTRTPLPLDQHQAAINIGNEILKFCGVEIPQNAVEPQEEEKAE